MEQPEIFKVLRDDVQAFISSNAGGDVISLALKKNPFTDISWSLILGQIDARSRAAQKLPEWTAADKILWPSKVSLEQTSSSETACYKASVIGSGNVIVDTTGGFGVDDYFFAQRFQKVIHCEIDQELSAIAKHNFVQLHAANIECVNQDSSNVIDSLSEKVDVIFSDPSRRNQSKGKVFMLSDCLPDVPGNLNKWLEKARKIAVKTSPLLDISAGLLELKHVKDIFIVAVKNEVRELLWIIEKEHNSSPKIHAVNLSSGHTEFCFSLDKGTNASYGAPEKFLYEPNAAVMKSGGFEHVSEQFNLRKLHKHSHLYTSSEIIGFPGRIFLIERQVPYAKQGFKTLSELGSANVTVRNFPATVDEVRKRHKINDGGDKYCFFTTDHHDNKIVLICSKI